MLESIRTRVGKAELYRKHNVHPQTFQAWRQKFMDGGKSCLIHHGKGDPSKTLKRKNGNLRRIIGELTIANDALKNLGGGQRLRTAKIVCQQMSMHKSRVHQCLKKTVVL